MKPTGVPEIDNSTAHWVVGSDEAGFGSWAGPLVVAGTRLPRAWSDPSVRDSKKLSEVKREAAYKKWTETTPVLYCRVSVGSEAIDRVGIWEALVQAHKRVLTELLKGTTAADTLVIVDGFKGQESRLAIPGVIGLPKADDLIPAVSLGSIIAKVSHDRYMKEMAKKYPQYGFDKSQGYGTKVHSDALRQFGPCPIHRRSYAPVAKEIDRRKIESG